MILSAIYSYPLKSGKAIPMEKAEVLSTGIRHDRTLVVIDEKDRALTGREYPELTSMVAKVEGNVLELSRDGQRIETALPKNDDRAVGFNLFRKGVKGQLVDKAAAHWVSNILGIPCRLVFIADNYLPIETQRGGKKGEKVGYADASPLHLISEASLHDLNARLEKQVTPLHFRPNLVVKGGKPYEEDNWKSVIINACEFEVHYKCKRCVFTSVDPVTFKKSKNNEPLTTLAKFRKERNEAVSFGIYLVPKKTGIIHLGNTVDTVV